MVIESQSYRNITQEAMHSAVLSSTLFILILWNVAFCQFLDEKCHGRDTSMRQRIIGGRDATVNSTPWMAGIYNITKDFICGGSLITKNFVLTAAHCLLEQKLLFVRLGENDRSCPDRECRREWHNVKTAMLHFNFNLSTLINDIGLLELKEEIRYSAQIAPICIILDEGLTSAGIDRFAAYGWGKTHPNNREGSQILKVILLTRKNTQECYSRGEIVQPSDKLFCAGADGGDTCGGDSGGPLVSSTRYMERDIRVQFGIVSYGTLSCDGNGVYTDVMSYKNWIKTRTSGQFDEKLVLYDQCGSSWSGGVNIRLWEVSLFEQNFTGSLITDRYVLTVASAFVTNPTNIQVETRYNERFDVEAIIKHPKFEASSLRNNIALLRLSRTVTSSYFLNMICLGLKPTPPTSLTAILYSDRKDIIGPQLVNFKQISKFYCFKGTQMPKQPNEFCVEKPRSDYTYDIPGSVMGTFYPIKGANKYHLVGMISYIRNDLIVFTNVTSFMDWILKTII